MPEYSSIEKKLREMSVQRAIQYIIATYNRDISAEFRQRLILDLKKAFSDADLHSRIKYGE